MFTMHNKPFLFHRAGTDRLFSLWIVLVVVSCVCCHVCHSRCATRVRQRYSGTQPPRGSLSDHYNSTCSHSHRKTIKHPQVLFLAGRGLLTASDYPTLACRRPFVWLNTVWLSTLKTTFPPYQRASVWAAPQWAVVLIAPLGLPLQRLVFMSEQWASAHMHWRRLLLLLKMLIVLGRPLTSPPPPPTYLYFLWKLPRWALI